MITRATVNICLKNNGYWQDAFRFGTTGDVTWSFTSKTFSVDVKSSYDDTASLLVLTTANGRVVVDDAVTRTLHFHVADTVFRPLLPPGVYVYDLVMIDSISNVRTVLMGGELTVSQGVTMD